MFFEPDELDEKLTKILKNELDKENVFATEDLIQRTLAATKKSSEKENVNNFQDESNSQKKHNTHKVINLNGKNNPKDKKNNKKVWIRSFACVAACIFFILIAKNDRMPFQFSSLKKADNQSDAVGQISDFTDEDKNESEEVTLYDMDAVNDASSETSPINDEALPEETYGKGASNSVTADGETTEGATADGGITAGSTNDKGAINDRVAPDTENFNQSTQNNVTFDATSNEIINSENSEDSLVGGADSGTSKANRLDMNDIITKEQEKDLGKTGITYITLSDQVKEEKQKLLDLNEQLETLTVDYTGNSLNVEWDYKVFTQSSEDGTIDTYFISKAGELKACSYNVNGLVSEADYKLENVDYILKMLNN